MSQLVPASGRWVTKKFPSKASTAYAVGMGIYNDGTDNVPVTTTTQQNFRGICLSTKASSDTSTDDIYVTFPASDDCTFFADCSGTLTKAMEGDQFDFASGGLTIAQAASTYDPVTLETFISSSRGEFSLNKTLGIEN